MTDGQLRLFINKSSNPKIRNSDNSGFTIVEVLVVTVITAIISLALSEAFHWTAKLQARSFALSELQSFQQGMLLALSNDTAWRATVAAGSSSGSASNMTCLALAQSCKSGGAPITDQPFALYDVNGSLIFDATDPTSGLTAQMTPCNSTTHPPGFNAGTGNDQCPFRYDLQWSAVCDPAGTCQNPQVRVNARLRYAPENNKLDKLIVDTNRFSIESFYILPSECSVQSKIYAVPGTYDFDVPTKFRFLVAEFWGGGGGGAAVDWACNRSPGVQGLNSVFNGQVAAGGAPGTTTMLFPSGSGGLYGPAMQWVFFCFNGPCGFIQFNPNYCQGAGDYKGGDGAAALASLFPDDQNMCNASIGFNPGPGGRYYGYNGSAVAGGGAGSASAARANPIPPFGCLGGGVCALHFWHAPPGQGGSGGQYERRTYTPATLSIPKVQVIVGAGGAGGVLGAAQGGRGGDGLVKITWW